MPSNSSTIAKALSISQSPNGSPLELIINGKSIKSGEFVAKEDAVQLPELRFKSEAPKLLGICLDLDAPFRSWGGLGPILHWLQHDLKTDETGKLTTDVPFIADYIGPAPPSISDPHRYIFLIYKQPDDFDPSKFRAAAEGKPFPLFKRMWYDADKWAKSAGVGEILGSIYFESK